MRPGLARAYPYPPNMKYHTLRVGTAKEARQAGRGIGDLSHAEQFELADRGTGIGEGSADCRMVTLQTCLRG